MSIFQCVRARSIAATVIVVATLGLPSLASAVQPLSVQNERAPVREDKVTVQLAVRDPAAQKLKIMSRSQPGALVEKDVNFKPSATVSAEIPADGVTVLKVPSEMKATTKELPKPPTDPTAVSDFPGLLVESRVDPTDSSVREIHQWVLVLFARQTPLQWNVGHRQYETELVVGLKSVDPKDDSSRPLDQPVVVRLFGEGVTVDPPDVKISQLGTAGCASVRLSLATHGAQGHVGAISDFGEQTYAVTAAAQLAAVTLISELTSIPGFGIGVTRVSALRSAEDGLEFDDPRPLSVALTASGGRLAHSSLSIKANEGRSDSVEFRSNWIHDVVLTPVTNGAKPIPVTVTFTTPWSYLVAILIGSLLGSVAHVVLNQLKFGLELLGAFLVGTILACAAFLGVGWTGLIPATAVLTELGCLVVAALTGYVGRPALDRVIAMANTKGSGPTPAPASQQLGPVKSASSPASARGK